MEKSHNFGDLEYIRMCFRDRKRLKAYYEYHHMKIGKKLMRATIGFIRSGQLALVFLALGGICIKIFGWG